MNQAIFALLALVQQFGDPLQSLHYYRIIEYLKLICNQIDTVIQNVYVCTFGDMQFLGLWHTASTFMSLMFKGMLKKSNHHAYFISSLCTPASSEHF